MRFHLPMPLHGWREFAGEVGIIVIGVLIALGAQQVAETIHLNQEVRAFRQTIDHEIGLNLFVYQVRARQFECETKRVAELRRWLDRARSGTSIQTIVARGPSTLTPYRSAWDNRNASVFNQLPADVRSKYAEFYDELASNRSLMEEENADWQRLEPYAEPGPISLADRRTILPLINGISGANYSLKANLPLSGRIAEVLHVRPVEPDNLPADWLAHVADCLPLTKIG